MARGILTQDELDQLNDNPYVIYAEEKRIVYSNEFKFLFINELHSGKKPSRIFTDAGFDISVLGSKRIERAAARWKESFAAGTLGSYDDFHLRKIHAANEAKRKKIEINKTIRTQSSKIKKLEHNIEIQKSKNESKLQRQKARHSLEISDLKQQKADLLQHQKICHSEEILSLKSKHERSLERQRVILEKTVAEKQVQLDRQSETIAKLRAEVDVLKKAGSLERRRCKETAPGKLPIFELIINRKCIQRIMRKFNLVCPIRTANPYKGIWKASKEDVVAPNLLQRKFKTGVPLKVLLTDITYLKHQGSFSYLSLILDAETNEPISYVLSKSLKVDFVIDSLKKIEHLQFSEDVLIHSDQGVHYTSKAFRKKLKEMNIRQSMSRKGNCLDNASCESFFGHMKQELPDIRSLSFDELYSEIDKYMRYYRYERYQENLFRLTPYEYHSLLAS